MSGNFCSFFLLFNISAITHRKVQTTRADVDTAITRAMTSNNDMIVWLFSEPVGREGTEVLVVIVEAVERAERGKEI